MGDPLPLGLLPGSAVVSTVAAGGGFDLTTVLASFGASVPLFLWLLKMHRDLISIVIPRGFKLIRHEMRRQGVESKKRHEEHIDIMNTLISSMEKGERPKPKKSRPQDAPGGTRTTAKAVRHPRKRRKRPSV